MTKVLNVLLFAAIFAAMTFCNGECDTNLNDPCSLEKSVSLEKDVVLGANLKSYDLSVYNETGKLDADAACHANFFIRVSWVDPPDVKPLPVPPVDFYFHTVFGYFPTPDMYPDGGADPNLWLIELDEAEDKNKPGETSYGVKVSLTDDWKPEMGGVRFRIFMSYPQYSENAYVAAKSF